MSLLSDITTALSTLKIPAQVGEYKTDSTVKLPSLFAVITPLNDDFECSDDYPEFDVQAASIELYSQSNPNSTIKSIVKECLKSGLTVTDRRFVALNRDTNYYHYSIGLENSYYFE